MPFQPKFTLSNQITDALLAIERTRGFLEGAPLPNEWICKMQDLNFTLEAHHGTHIAKTSLSLDQSKRLMQGEILSESNAEDVKKLLSLRRTLDFATTQAVLQESLSESLIKEIHSRIVDSSSSLYRTTQNSVTTLKNEVLHTPPSSYNIPFLMSKLLLWLQNENSLHPVLIAGIVQFQLSHISPFATGNERTSRLLTLLCLYKSGYDFKKLLTISEYYNRNRQGYYLSLYSGLALTQDMTTWLEYFTKAIQNQTSKIQHQVLHTLKIERAALEHKLSLRQKKVLESLPIQEHGLTIQDFESSFPGLHRRTLQRELAFLIQKGLLFQTGIKKGVSYKLGAIE